MTESGQQVTCDDMRSGCDSMAPDACGPGSYSYLEEALTPDDPASSPQPCGGLAPKRCEFALVGKHGPDRLVGTDEGDDLRGRGGRDRLRGRGGRDCLRGGAGADRLNGGPHADRLAAGAGGDRVNARDGERDRVRCGPGHDRARVDRHDRARGCEVCEAARRSGRC